MRMAAARALPSIGPVAALIAWQSWRAEPKGRAMTDRDETFDKVAQLIAPFNKKGVALDRRRPPSPAISNGTA